MCSGCDEPTYGSMKSVVWTELVECTNGDAGAIVEEAEDLDGRGAYMAMEGRYNSDSLNSKFMSIQALFLLKQTLPIDQHVTLLKSHVRNFQELGTTLAPDFQCMIFLMILSEKVKAFTTNAMMQGNQSLQALYNGTVE